MMARGQKQYTEEFKNTIVELYNSGKSLVELSREYALSKSTIAGWIKKNKPIAVDKDTTITAVNYQAVLKVSRSSYYKYLNKKPSNRELENTKIEKEIINIHKASKNPYGAVKINESLKTLGINISATTINEKCY